MRVEGKINRLKISYDDVLSAVELFYQWYSNTSIFMKAL